MKISYFKALLIGRILSPFISSNLDIKRGVKIHFGSTVDSMTTIGKYSYIGKYVSITSSEIGNYCSIANNAIIGQGEHDLEKISTSSKFYNKPLDVLLNKDCIIGNDVWIGASSIILRGVHIGDGTVIGANCVVTKDVPPYSIVVGIPGSVIRKRLSESKIKIIRESKWWENDLDEAKKIINTLF